jgi:ACS family hexuronate transporter-like MFS transporter
VFTLTSDLFPRNTVASVVGLGSVAGAGAGALISLVVGLLLQYTGSYLPVFIMAGSAYLLALLVVHGLVPQLRPVEV